MDSVWQEIKDKLQVEEIIGEYIPVLTSGSSFRAVCPFHKEKTPSLMISPDRQVWHCFGCGAGGDVFAFVCQIENITKKEALDKLAKKTGVELKKLPKKEASENTLEENTTTVGEFESGGKLLEWVANVYHKILLKILEDRNHPVTQYCLKRNLSSEIINQFKIGYAPKGNTILQLATKHSLDLNLLEKISILKLKTETKEENNVIRSQNSNIFKDKFNDRLMIPVHNKQGNIVGFTGRVLPYDTNPDRPRYLNSSQSQWFNKSELWFGWTFAKKTIIQEKKALIVEGNMDVIAAFGYNLKFAVASQGTSFTSNQLKILKTITSTIWLAFDNDQAGRVSGEKFFKMSAGLGFGVYKVVIPTNYKDLDEYLNTENNTNFKILPYLDWVILDRDIDLRSGDLEKQKIAILGVLDLLQYTDALGKEQYLKKLADITKISLNTLQSISSLDYNSINISITNDQDTRQDISVQQSTLVTLQNLTTSNLKSSSIDIEKLGIVFLLLQKFIPELLEWKDFNDYISENQDIFEVILKQNHDLLDTDKQQTLWNSIVYFLDSRVGQLMLDEEAKDLYLKLKSGGRP